MCGKPRVFCLCIFLPILYCTAFSSHSYQLISGQYRGFLWQIEMDVWGQCRGLLSRLPVDIRPVQQASLTHWGEYPASTAGFSHTLRRISVQYSRLLSHIEVNIRPVQQASLTHWGGYPASAAGFSQIEVGIWQVHTGGLSDKYRWISGQCSWSSHSYWGNPASTGGFSSTYIWISDKSVGCSQGCRWISDKFSESSLVSHNVAKLKKLNLIFEFKFVSWLRFLRVRSFAMS